MTAQTAIDCLEFAEKSLAIHGTITLLSLPRLQDALADTAGELAYSLRGGRNARGETELALRVQGELVLICQRCLGALPFRLDTLTRFVLVKDEAGLPKPEDEDAAAEYLVAQRSLDVATLVEDEVLLNLPLAPMHAQGQCGDAPDGLREGRGSPFGVLQGFKPGRN